MSAQRSFDRVQLSRQARIDGAKLGFDDAATARERWIGAKDDSLGAAAAFDESRTTPFQRFEIIGMTTYDHLSRGPGLRQRLTDDVDHGIWIESQLSPEDSFSNANCQHAQILLDIFVRP